MCVCVVGLGENSQCVVLHRKEAEQWLIRILTNPSSV